MEHVWIYSLTYFNIRVVKIEHWYGGEFRQLSAFINYVTIMGRKVLYFLDDY